jgi:DNA-binding NarL/FixJ family response regulator
MHQSFGDLTNEPLNRNGDRPHPRQTVRVAILESNDLLRDGLAALVSITQGLALAGAWGDVDEALDEMPERLPDVALVDVKLPERSGFRALKAFPLVCPQTRAIMLVDCREDRCVVLNPQTSAAHVRSLRTVPAAFSGPDDCLQISLKMGAHGVLRKDCSFAEMTQAIRAVYAGQCWMELPTATRLAQQYLLSMRASHPAARSGAQSLTLRERQVVSLISHGRSNKEIAHELQLGYSTVKNYVSNILEKLALSDRTQIALYAIQSSSAEAP